MSTDVNESSPPRPPRRRLLRFSLVALFFVVFYWGGLLLGVRVGSQRFVLNPDPLRLTVPQRSSQVIPGLQEKAVVQLDDITDGKVMLSIYDDAKAPILAPVSVRAGNVLPFKVNQQQFFLHVVELHNELIGDDFGVVEISSDDRWTKKP